MPHLAFMLVLLLPTVLIRRDDGWSPAPTLTVALAQLVLSFAVFSFAHGLALGLAGLDVIRAPAALVAATVVVSVLLLAANNGVRSLGAGLPLVVFFLGLFHGLELARSLSVMPFRISSLKRVLLGYTVGVELGQAALVGVVFPWIFVLRKTKLYVPAMLVVGAIVVVLAVAAALAEWVIGP
jgi:hypothetical protein